MIGHIILPPEPLPTALIRTDGGTQPRASLNQQTVDDYARDLARGDVFPPVTVFYDGQSYWLADGFHRLKATQQTGASTITAQVRSGTRREAILYSLGANTSHGLRRSNADKRRAVLTLLSDPEWLLWSNAQIAKQCGVDEGLIRKLKGELTSDNPNIDPEYARKCGVDLEILWQVRQQIENQPQECQAKRRGKIYTVGTAKIGNNNKRRIPALGTTPEDLTTAQFELPVTGVTDEPGQVSEAAQTDTKINPAIRVLDLEQESHEQSRGEENSLGTTFILRVAVRENWEEMFVALAELMRDDFAFAQTVFQQVRRLAAGTDLDQNNARILD